MITILSTHRSRPARSARASTGTSVTRWSHGNRQALGWAGPGLGVSVHAHLEVAWLRSGCACALSAESALCTYPPRAQACFQGQGLRWRAGLEASMGKPPSALWSAGGHRQPHCLASSSSRLQPGPPCSALTTGQLSPLASILGPPTPAVSAPASAVWGPLEPEAPAHAHRHAWQSPPDPRPPEPTWGLCPPGQAPGSLGGETD